MKWYNIFRNIGCYQSSEARRGNLSQRLPATNAFSVVILIFFKFLTRLLLTRHILSNKYPTLYCFPDPEYKKQINNYDDYSFIHFKAIVSFCFLFTVYWIPNNNKYHHREIENMLVKHRMRSFSMGSFFNWNNKQIQRESEWTGRRKQGKDRFQAKNYFS